MSPYGSTLETQSCVRSINSHGSSVPMNERFARRRGAAVLSFSFPLARSALGRPIRETFEGNPRRFRRDEDVAPCCFASSTSTRAGSELRCAGSPETALIAQMRTACRPSIPMRSYRCALASTSAPSTSVSRRRWLRAQAVFRSAATARSPDADVLGAWTFRTLAHRE